MEKVLITGATGFLGKYLVKQFCDKEYDVTAFGRNESVGKGLEAQYGARFFSGDLKDAASVEKAARNAGIIVHSGALSTVWGKWEDFYNINVLGTKSVLNAALVNKVGRVVFVSSPSVYTEQKDRFDIKEEEFDSGNKLNYYIQSKILAEKEAAAIDKKVLQTVIIRPRGLFGIGDTSIIPRLLKANNKVGIPLLNGGKNVVDITYVANAAYAVYLAATSKNIRGGEVFNITNGEPMEFGIILEAFLREIGLKPKYLKLNYGLLYSASCFLEFIYRSLRLKGEPMFTRYTVATLGFSQTLNIDRAKSVLGYKPIYSIEEGIRIYADWYRKNNSDR